jgi:hypothetical protein
MLRFCTYAIKLMKRFNKELLPGQYDIRHIANTEIEYKQESDSEDEEIESVKHNTQEVLALIVPFLSEENLHEVKEVLASQTEKVKRKFTYVVSIFAEVETLTTLSMEFKNINIVNILCIVKMSTLLLSLANNCRSKYDFVGNEELVGAMIELSGKEVRRKEKHSEVTE